MAEQLKDLIEKIQDEGIRAAEAEAKVILARAERDAAGIIQKAKQEAARITLEADQVAKHTQETAVASLKQAGRDFLLGLRQEIGETLKRIMLMDVRQGLSAEEITRIIAKLIESHKETGGKIIISVSKPDLEKVEKLLMARLKNQIKNGITLKGSEEISGGFIISYDDNKSHFDFSDKALTEYLAANLEPDLQGLLMK